MKTVVKMVSLRASPKRNGQGHTGSVRTHSPGVEKKGQFPLECWQQAGGKKHKHLGGWRSSDFDSCEVERFSLGIKSYSVNINGY